MADTAPLPVPRRRRRRWPIVLAVVVVALVAAAAIGLPLADAWFRAQAERQIGESIDDALPSGVHGTASARIVGGSALQQYLAGRFDDVTVQMLGLSIDGESADADAEVHGLPVHGGRIGDATVRLSVDQATVRSLAPLSGTQASAPTLGDGTVSTTVTQKVLSVPIEIRVVLRPSLSGTTLRLTPSDATLRSGSISVPATTIVQALYPDGISVCTARYLPPGVRLTALSVRSAAVAVTLSASDVDLDALQSGRTGTC